MFISNQKNLFVLFFFVSPILLKSEVTLKAQLEIKDINCITLLQIASEKAKEGEMVKYEKLKTFSRNIKVNILKNIY